MADINIQKKEGGPPILPILLGVVALGVVIAAIMYFMGNGDAYTDTAPGALPYDTAPAAATTDADGALPAEVRAYRDQCADASQFRDEMAQDHDYEAECMRRLAEGLDAVIRRETVADQPLQQRVSALRDRANQITQDPQATDHANRVRGAADEAADIMEYMASTREAVGANLQQHARQTREAANQIDTGTVLLEQRQRTSTFFARAGEALEALAQSRQGQPR
jgi:hypothetical protein